MPTISVAGLFQGHLHARAAVGLAALLMDLDNEQSQARIFPGARAGLGLALEPVVVAAGRNFQGFAERTNGMLGFHRVNPLKPLDGGSERMPKVFLKCPAVGANSRSRAADRHFRLPVARREALPPGTESLGMNPQLGGHFRGRFAAVEPELNSLLFKGLVKLPPGVLGLDHRRIHNCFVFQCLSLPVSVFSRRPIKLLSKNENKNDNFFGIFYGGV